jgi:hypothetical protein
VVLIQRDTFAVGVFGVHEGPVFFKGGADYEYAECVA